MDGHIYIKKYDNNYDNYDIYDGMATDRATGNMWAAAMVQIQMTLKSMYMISMNFLNISKKISRLQTQSIAHDNFRTYIPSTHLITKKQQCIIPRANVQEPVSSYSFTSK